MTDVANKDVWCQLLVANNKEPNGKLCGLLVTYLSTLERQRKLSLDLFLELTKSTLLPPSKSVKEALCLVQLEQRVVGQEVALSSAQPEQQFVGQLEEQVFEDVGRGFEPLTLLQHARARARARV